MSVLNSDPSLHADLAAFIGGGAGERDALALRLFAYQRACNPDYAAFVGPDVRVTTIHEIPCVPVALWRDLPLVSFPVEDTQQVFRTSGTTGRRGVVRRRDTTLYDLGARRFAEQVVGPIPSIGVSLVPDAVDSSLGHMCRQFSPELRVRFTGAAGVDVQAAWADLREFAQAHSPVFVPGTALALAQLVAGASEPVPLAPGSIVMVTGGFKGQTVSVSAGGLRSELVRLLPGATVVEEYGMTELSSQMWAEGPGMPLRIPPWMLVSVVDPWTGAPAKRGLLRFIDLANFDTVLAIETRDEGELLPDGRLILHGRLPGAPARGCSLTVEEAMDGLGAAPAEMSEPTLLRRVGAVVDDDRRRARRMVQALSALPAPRAEWGQGIEATQVALELEQAVARLSEVALLEEVSTVPVAERPSTVALVAAEGVFTAALEWVALTLVGGIRVQWKPPSRAPRFAHDVGAVLAAHGFPVTVDVGRQLETPDVVVVFGADETIRRIEADHPAARVVGYGHRFAVAVVEGAPSPEQAQRLLEDHLRFDTRGCMAPAGLFVVGEPVRSWMHGLPDCVVRFEDALAAAAVDVAPQRVRGPISPALGPEWRRRLGLARATLGVATADDFVAVGVRPEHFVPVALPWLASVVPVRDRAHLVDLVDAHAERISVLARPASLAPLLDERVNRTCALGELQSPPFPRHHDGQPMFARVCGWEG